MITKYKQYNESIKSLLVGPTKEEVWDDLMNGKLKGFLKTIPESPEDFFLQMKDGCTVKNNYWIKKGIKLFLQDTKYNWLWVNYEYIWLVFKKVYGLNFDEIQSLINSLLVKDKNWNGLIPMNSADRWSSGLLEGIKHLLVGPSDEEIWKHYGYDKPFDTPKEYFDSVVKDAEIKERPHTQSSIYWVKNGKYIIQYELDTSYLYMSKEMKTIFGHIFNISIDELIELFSDFVGEQLNWKKFKKVYPSYLERFWNR